METAGVHPIRVYIRSRQATIAERVAFRPIYKMYMEAERMPGMIRLVQRWKQDAVDETEE